MKRGCVPVDCTDNSPSKVALMEKNLMPLLDPGAVAKTSQRDLISLAMEIEKADSYIKANTCGKLQLIADHMKFLTRQAENVLLEAEHNMKLHHAACNFVKQPGHVYHLYERESGQCYFSMLSPTEWGNSGPRQNYKGSFRLEQDHSWTPARQAEAKDNKLAMLDKMFARDTSTSSAIRSMGLNMNA